VRVLAIYELDEPNNYETVTLGSGPDNYLMVMRALKFDDADVRTGMDTYCLVTGSQLTLYGGVDEFSIDERRLRLSFSPEAVQTLRVPPEWVIDIEGDGYRQVTTALARLLA
jgi:hypothetical protein